MKGGAHGVSSLGTPYQQEGCLVMFGKSFGVDTHVEDRIIIIIFSDHIFAFAPSASSLTSLGTSPPVFLPSLHLKIKRPNHRSSLLQSWSSLVMVFFQLRDWTSKH
jgi:hypothetical protein